MPQSCLPTKGCCMSCLSLVSSSKTGAGISGVVSLRDIAARTPVPLSEDVLDCVALLLVWLVGPADAPRLQTRSLETAQAKLAAMNALRLRRTQRAIAEAGVVRDDFERFMIYMGIAEYLIESGEAHTIRDWLEIIANEAAPRDWDYRCRLGDQGLCMGAQAWALIGDLDGAEKAILSHHFSLSSSPVRLNALERARIHAYAAFGLADRDPAQAASLLESAQVAAEDVAGEWGRAHSWLRIARVCLWTGRREAARHAARAAATAAIAAQATSPQRGEYDYGSEPVHEDPFHGPCRQGFRLHLALVAARAGDLAQAADAAALLVSEGARDGLDALMEIARAASRTGDNDTVARTFLQASELVARVTPPIWQLVTRMQIRFGLAGTGWPDTDFPVDSVEFRSELDRLLQERDDHQDSGLPAALDEVLNLRAAAGERGATLTQPTSRPPRPRLSMAPSDPSAVRKLRARESANVNKDLEALQKIIDDRASEDRSLSYGEYLDLSDAIHEQAIILSRLGETDRAVAAERSAFRARIHAVESRTMLKIMLMHHETEDEGEREIEGLYYAQVVRLVELAEIAFDAGAPQTGVAFLKAAEIHIPTNHPARGAAAAVIAKAASAAGHLDAAQLALGELAITREQELTKIFVAYCQAHAGTAPDPIPPGITALVAELYRDLPSAVRACGGMGLLYPDSASAIRDSLSLLT